MFYICDETKLPYEAVICGIGSSLINFRYIVYSAKRNNVFATKRRANI
jgi:hypothetical protein